MKVNRNKITVLRLAAKQTDEAARLEKAEALSFVWDLTKEIYSLSGRFDVKSRLQRNAISIIGKEIVEIEGLSVPVISKQNLIINKLATGRDKDKIDANNLKNS